VVPESAGGGSPRERDSVPEVIVSLLGFRLDTARARWTVWPLLAVAGLLTVPAECARIGHPHSLFQNAGAAQAPPTHAEGPPHSAAGHDHAGSGGLPAWATPSGDVLTSTANDAVAAHAHPAHPYSGAPALPQATPPTPPGDDLPIVEPAAPTVIAAFGTSLALLVALAVLFLPGTPLAAKMIAPLSGLLARALDPPPPRERAVAC
jgi:hypothetical protein